MRGREKGEPVLIVEPEDYGPTDPFSLAIIPTQQEVTRVLKRMRLKGITDQTTSAGPGQIVRPMQRLQTTGKALRGSRSPVAARVVNSTWREREKQPDKEHLIAMALFLLPHRLVVLLNQHKQLIDCGSKILRIDHQIKTASDKLTLRIDRAVNSNRMLEIAD